MCIDWRKIMFKVKVKGLNNLEKKVNSIIQKLPETAKKSVEDILKETRTCAIKLERGHNSNGIIMELVDIAKNQIKGRIYADPSKFMVDDKQSYLWFEYFGTGEFAEEKHIGTTKHFKETGYTEWYIPVSKVGRTLNFPIENIGGKQFYVAHGAKANHFLANAEFETRADNIESFEKNMKMMLEEVCK